MPYLNLDRLRATAVAESPFQHVIVPGFLSRESIERINDTFPQIPSGGSYSIESLTTDMAIKDVIDELNARECEEICEQKFNVRLLGHPKMYSLRGYTRAKDGRIHTDSKDKIITVLLYLNRSWPHATGRLRLLRDGKTLDNYAVEIPPDNGTLLVFKRSNTSWHGHLPFVGPRRALQMNWMTNERRASWHALRHWFSEPIKRICQPSRAA
jgi:SM-20-related protein